MLPVEVFVTEMKRLAFFPRRGHGFGDQGRFSPIKKLDPDLKHFYWQ